MGFAQYAGILLPALRASLLLLLVVVAAPLGAAPPDVTSLFPAGGAPGETADVTATGTFGNWPLNIWSSDPALQVECGKDKGKLKIKIGESAVSGIAWLRLVDGEGASPPRPFVIAAQPSLREKEPNDSPAKAQQVAVPAVVHGKFDKNGDSDGYRVELTAGQTLVASLQSHEVLGSPADGALQICTEDGQVLAMNQDAVGLDPLVTFRSPTGGTYLVRTFALPVTPNSSINFAGGELFLYRLTITTGALVSHTLPLAISPQGSTPVALQGWNLNGETIELSAPTNPIATPWLWSPPQAAGLVPMRVSYAPLQIATAAAATAEGQAISTPCSLTGVIGKPREVHHFVIAGKKGAKLVIAAESFNLDYELDPLLKISTPDGSKLAEADDMGKDRDPTLNVTFPTDGNYLLEVRDLHRSGGPRHVYRLQIEPPAPRLAMTIAANTFVIEAGKTLEVPVTIARQNGLNEELSVSAVDLPAGVTVTSATSQSKGDTAKQVKLTLTAAEDAQAGSFRIVATADEKELAAAAFPLTLGGSTFQFNSIWLAVKGKR